MRNHPPSEQTLKRIHEYMRRQPSGTRDLADRLALEFRRACGQLSCRHDSGNPFRAASWVYMLHAPRAGVIKIGSTRDVNAENRMRDLQTGSPEQLEVVSLTRGCSESEAAVHAHFRAYRRHGEWFEAAPVIAALKSALCLACSDVLLLPGLSSPPTVTPISLPASGLRGKVRP